MLKHFPQLLNLFSLEFNRIGDLSDRRRRYFADNGKPKIALSLTHYIHRALLHRPFGAALRARLDKNRDGG